MQLSRETFNYQGDAFDRTENAATFIGTEIFPAVLHSMLDEVEERGYSHIVSWQPHGRCFVVHNRSSFVNFIMPAFFRMSKFASFQRQLNLYDYKRITAGPDKGGYYHENFVRGRKGLCKYILRQQIKGTSTRKPFPEIEPDFYRLGMVRCPDVDKVEFRCQEDIANPTSLSDLLTNARAFQINANRMSSMQVASMLPGNLAAKHGFSAALNDQNAMARQQYTTMTVDDVQGRSDHSLFSATGSAPRRFPQLCDGPSAATHHNPDHTDHNNHHSECYHKGCESIVPMSHSTRYVKRMIQVSNHEQDVCGGNESVISMLCPSRSPRCEETRCILSMNNEETQFVGNEHHTSTAYNGDFDCTGFELLPTSFYPRLTMGAPDRDGPFVAMGNNVSFGGGAGIDWMAQQAYH